MCGTDCSFGFENLDGELGYLVKKHRFDIPRGKDLGFIEGFVVGVTEEEGHEPGSEETGQLW